jgi:uncharacterized membrane protein
MIVAICVISFTALACTFIVSSTWLRAAEMQRGPQRDEVPRASATASLTIEYASLKERVRKLERIADGVEA